MPEQCPRFGHCRCKIYPLVNSRLRTQIPKIRVSALIPSALGDVAFGVLNSSVSDPPVFNTPPGIGALNSDTLPTCHSAIFLPFAYTSTS